MFFCFCFLIISCDLPNEADADCNGDNRGTAYIDDCGRCVAGNTGFIEGYDKDDCDQCYGDNSCLDGLCNDATAINYHAQLPDNAVADNSLCIYDMCTDYLPASLSSNEYSCDNSNANNGTYSVGDKLKCSDIEKSYSVCYPENCSSAFKLADFYGKAIWIEMTASWWTSCYADLSSVDSFILEYLDEPNLIIINYFYDEWQPYSCANWGAAGDNRLPIMINDGAFNNADSGNDGLDMLFYASDAGVPKYIFINKDMELHYKNNSYMSEIEVKTKIDEMLDEF